MTDPVEVIGKAIAPSAWADANFLGNQEWRDLTRAKVRDAIAALRANGMAIVPIKSTESMNLFGEKAIEHVQGWSSSITANLCWNAMISKWLDR